MPIFKITTTTPLLFFFCLSLLFLSSCNAQEKVVSPKETEPVKEATSQVKAAEEKVEEELPEYDPYFIETEGITSSKGPASITRSILQDRNGHYWFASWEGIIRYDGKTFTNFTNKEKLRRFHVFSLLEDSNGVLWFGTIRGGLYRYDGKTFTNFTTKDGLANDGVLCIYEDKKGHIWFGTMDGISCYDPSLGKVNFRNITTENGLPNNDVNSIIEDKNGKFWIGSRGPLCYYDPAKSSDTGEMTFNILKNNMGQSFINVRTIIEDQNDNIWFGGNDGLWRFDGLFLLNGISLTNYTKDFVGRIYEDRKGNLWVNSAVEGSPERWKFSRYDVNTLLEHEPVVSHLVEAEDMFFGIEEDSDGAIWFGGLYGVCRYDGDGELEYFR